VFSSCRARSGCGRLDGLDGALPLASGSRPSRTTGRSEGLDHGAGAVAARDHQLVVVDLLQQAEFLQVVDDDVARLVAVEAAVFLRDVVVERGVRGEDVDQRQVVALPMA
jgi:hypothetical protein